MAGSVDEVKVLGAWSSPFVMRPRLALAFKGVEYEFLQETFLQEPFGSKSELLLKSNPVYKKMPVLIHKGNPVCESLVIVEYVEDAFGGPSLFPADPYLRAIARFWAVYLDDKFFPAIWGALGATPAESAEQVATGLNLMEEAFEKCSQGKAFFNGDTVGYLDIGLGSLLGWLRAAEKVSGNSFLDEGKTPLLAEWAAKFSALPAVTELMPETEKLVEFTKKLHANGFVI